MKVGECIFGGLSAAIGNWQSRPKYFVWQQLVHRDTPPAHASAVEVIRAADSGERQKKETGSCNMRFGR